MLYRPCLIKLVNPDDPANWYYHLREQKLPFFITLAHEFLHALNQLERITWILGTLGTETMEEFFAELNLINSKVCNENNLVCNILCLFNKEKLNKYNLLDFSKRLKMKYHEYRKGESSLTALLETIFPIQKFLAKKLKLQNDKGFLEEKYNDFWQNGKNDDSLDEMTVILGSERRIGETEFVFIGETTFLREYYLENSIISWSHDSARNINFWQKMSAILNKNYVKHVFKAHKFNLNVLHIQTFELDKDQILSEKYYFYKGNSTQEEKLKGYLQNEVNTNGVAIKTILLLENKSVVCSGGKFIRKVEKEFWQFVTYSTKTSSIRLLPKYWKLEGQNNKTQNYYYRLNDKFNTLNENEIIIIKL